MEYISNTLGNLVDQTAFMNLTFGNLIMIAVACVFLYLAIHHGFEPLLLVPIAFGMLLVNIYPDIMLHAEDAANGTGGLLYYFYQLDEWSILPSLIFLGVGAMTDFGPLIANPKSFLLGAVWYLCRLSWSDGSWIFRQGSSSYLYYRRCRRSDIYLPCR
jgi:Na+-transporting methylmalonyl-CoA/oxaloacetate decarboxylase beta subunit